MAIKISGTTVIDDGRNITNANTAEFTGNLHIKVPAGTTEQRSGTPAEGMFRYNTSEEKFEGYTSKGWGSIGGGGFEEVEIITTSRTANTGSLHVILNTLTLTLPFSPDSGDLVGVVNRSGNTDVILARNGETIMGLAEDLTIDVDGAGFTLVYADATRGWVII
jgi:hypothetical protein